MNGSGNFCRQVMGIFSLIVLFSFEKVLHCFHSFIVTLAVSLILYFSRLRDWANLAVEFLNNSYRANRFTTLCQLTRKIDVRYRKQPTTSHQMKFLCDELFMFYVMFNSICGMSSVKKT